MARAWNIGRRQRGGLLAIALLLHACAAPPPIENTPALPYRLSAGDVLKLTVYGEEQMSGQFRVSENGTIAVPLIGSVHASGLTAGEVEADLAATLQARNLLPKPSVTAEILSYRPVAVLGEVARPGQFAYQPGMTVLTAIALAGGFTYSAQQQTVLIQRRTDHGPIEGAATRNDWVHPGDVITVKERYF